MDDEIRGILDDLRKLQERVDKYLNKQGIQDPIDPLPIFPQPWVPQTPIEQIPNSRCPKCNLELSPVMGYVCTQQDCPTGLGGPSCTGSGGHSALTTEGKTLC